MVETTSISGSSSVTVTPSSSSSTVEFSSSSSALRLWVDWQALSDTTASSARPAASSGWALIRSPR